MCSGGVLQRFNAGLALSLALLVPGTAVARLAPVPDKPYRHMLIEERSDDRGMQRFVSERRLVFHPLPTGFALDLTILDASAPANGSGAMFAAALAGLKGRTVRFLLDQEGRILGIDDAAAVWAALCAAVDRAAAASPPASAARQRAADAMAAAFRTLPAHRRQDMLSSLVNATLAGALAARLPVEDSAISISARSPTGMPVALPGRETVRIIDDRTILITTTAQGDVTAPPPGATGPSRISVTISKRVDRAAGLILESREQRETTLGAGPTARRNTSLTVSRLDPPVF
ncbi:MAG: hypothetical protein BVN32_12825 [Proteobacteria bacterium ST_bin14]|nr:MAG: hypothetical protein BVN32_12825 [Proteobacteria bacterium ST_bin14]